MISKDKTYRTRDGREVRIYATDGDNGGIIHGAVFSNGWQFRLWYSDGCYDRDVESNLDLIEVKPRIKRTVWLNVHVNRSVIAHNFREEADNLFSKDVAARIACIKIDLDFEEGEGL
jgi:hypothetical protein